MHRTVDGWEFNIMDNVLVVADGFFHGKRGTVAKRHGRELTVKFYEATPDRRLVYAVFDQVELRPSEEALARYNKLHGERDAC